MLEPVSVLNTGLGVQNGHRFGSLWLVMNVVCYVLICYERVFMNVVCLNRSVMNVVFLKGNR